MQNRGTNDCCNASSQAQTRLVRSIVKVADEGHRKRRGITQRAFPNGHQALPISQSYRQGCLGQQTHDFPSALKNQNTSSRQLRTKSSDRIPSDSVDLIGKSSAAKARLQLARLRQLLHTAPACIYPQEITSLLT